jgi:hypothetical protein
MVIGVFYFTTIVFLSNYFYGAICKEYRANFIHIVQKGNL